MTSSKYDEASEKKIVEILSATLELLQAATRFFDVKSDSIEFKDVDR